MINADEKKAEKQATNLIININHQRATYNGTCKKESD